MQMAAPPSSTCATARPSGTRTFGDLGIETLNRLEHLVRHLEDLLDGNAFRGEDGVGGDITHGDIVDPSSDDVER
jgi:hypothetical protein